MPMWRCPHCATPQAETARCWVCHQSSTACSSCRHFRRSVAAQIGYCGLDRERRPLRGDEIRECWESRDAAGGPGAPARPTLGPAAGWAVEPGTDRTTVRLLDFVEVQTEAHAEAHDGIGTSPPTPRTPPGEDAGGAAGPHFRSTSGEPRWSLWGDAEA
jgi:hypothetical protein